MATNVGLQTVFPITSLALTGVLSDILCKEGQAPNPRTAYRCSTCIAIRQVYDDGRPTRCEYLCMDPLEAKCEVRFGSRWRYFDCLWRNCQHEVTGDDGQWTFCFCQESLCNDVPCSGEFYEARFTVTPTPSVRPPTTTEAHLEVVSHRSAQQGRRVARFPCGMLTVMAVYYSQRRNWR